MLALSLGSQSSEYFMGIPVHKAANKKKLQEAAQKLKAFNSFMNGQKSAEEVSKLIQNRVMTYLNE
ncbi:hypothetical protein BVG16_21290 [Paenibacillus selenitireducens]|uniref:Uncharacterized protein n=1 Tax=Paenibacillus selenitireducens TaxID=1324314 RepID=A0A1T2X5Q6_9BACL|nr:hypothetical protein [Paenibacillus selenitireducens]OPA75145.1 hypothetical protein BVG16_21290 [Paenibacillus selenitireducens]